MKKFILFFFLLGLLHAASGQSTEPVPQFDKEYFLKKSRKQKTAAWIFLGAGTAMIGVAAPGNVSFDILPVLVIGGGTCIITSIPLFIAAARNKRKAANLAFEMKTVPRLETAGPVSQALPSLTLKIQL